SFAGQDVHSFAIGGFELFIDDVTVGPLGAFEMYYANFNDSTVYRYREGSGTFPVYSRPTSQPDNLLNYFEFAPWNASQLYYINSAGYDVYDVDLASSSPSEAVVHTHVVDWSTEQVRCVAFDAHGNLYLSDLDRLGSSLGRIWKLNAFGGSTAATLIWTVENADTGWSNWNGHFAIDPHDTIYISGGNIEPASIYTIDFTTNTLVQVFSHPTGSVCGMAFGPDGLLYYADPKEGGIFRLDLSTGARTLALATGTNLSDVGFREFGPATMVSPTPLVMLEGIGGIRLDQIATGPGREPGLIKEYVDGISDQKMTNAPFGGRLGMQINASSSVPTPGPGGVYYYLIQYKHTSWANWKDMTEPLYAKYVSQLPGQLATFPQLKLGPYPVAGKGVYRFLPHSSDLPALVSPKPGEQVSWPSKPFPGEEYEGFLDTVGLGLTAGLYDVRLLVYDENGALTPGAAYDFMIPDGPSSWLSPTVVASDYSFPLAVDNRHCFAGIDPPTVAGTAADQCGFLRYQNVADMVQLQWHAIHPAQHAMYSFQVHRGATPILGYFDEVSSPAHNGDTTGNFLENYVVSDLLGRACSEAAFNAHLYVRAKATTGNGLRINKYDASANFAFALTPE
ncbi:MAG: hypothetical protein JSW27_20380, partial [Phycisphaerales bacterium]